ncbi:unnamed protein product [Acanthoscelides obtectus]|uniref:Gamma-interferon-inducible lysosomal thiol reductase n=1 Tax=Acanthoscelides obtectus TaxID=200917 RepID=A0A9P0KCL8_ACAOB|nr:unnamed protein product [Acanthoscelides obtectus]CAK1628126.1 Gamma-interferon-inducible lysosomal thiol reductase [Acanthoscelides obtectus]
MYEPYLPEPDNAIERVRVEVYYEALCPDSKYFIIYQLLTVFEEFQNHIILDLIPYGKAETLVVDGKLQFHCQHGETECYANKIHACVIDHVNNPVKQLKYIACMIKDNMIPDVAGEKCGQEQGIDFKPISQCAKGDKGTQFLKFFGEKTHSLNPPVRFIPTILLNGSQTVVPQSTVLKDFLKAICSVLKFKPKLCGYKENNLSLFL